MRYILKNGFLDLLNVMGCIGVIIILVFLKVFKRFSLVEVEFVEEKYTVL